MKRAGRQLQQLPDRAPRRLADGRNAWRKMNREQRAEFLRFIMAEPEPWPEGFSLKARGINWTD